jgi:hypothetical protein
VVFGVDEDDAQDEGVGVEGVDRLCEPWNVWCDQSFFLKLKDKCLREEELLAVLEFLPLRRGLRMP